MKSAMNNWKTSFIGLIIFGCGMYIGIKSGNWELATPVVLSGVGLIVAKDGNHENNL